jgi:predicted Rossmann fold flavoprotein
LKIIVIGGGAAGFFAAIHLAKNFPKAEVKILEKNSKFLSKVKVSGGGRCNVTHEPISNTKFSLNYPRGSRELKKLFEQFSAQDMINWLKEKSVDLKIETDGRVFPQSNSSQTIIDVFLEQTQLLGIELILNTEVCLLQKHENGFNLQLQNQEIIYADKVVVTIGGSNKIADYHWLSTIGHQIVEPIPSLFTFNDWDKHFADLSGVSVPDALVKIPTTKFSQNGPLLLTHWGLSGPAIIKLSAWAAAYLHQKKYVFTILVSWIGERGEEEVRDILVSYKIKNHLKKVYNYPLFGLPARLWERICSMAEIAMPKIWAEMSNKEMNKLLEFLIRCPFSIKGKTTFKEEFVTCGGIDLNEVNLETMESKLLKSLYFAGEVLNIDGVTGGFNFQAAWTTAWLAAQLK